MAKLSNIEVAYQFLKNKKDGADFNEIWNAVASEIHNASVQKSRLIADLYSEMVLDNRFALTSDGKWALRSNMSANDVKKQYDYVDAFDYDADFDDIDDDDTMDLDDDDESEIDADDDDEDDEDEDDYDSSENEDSFDDVDN